MVWCINGLFVWYPLAAPWTEFPGEVDIGGGVTACIGATIFEVGSVLLMLEAINENREYLSVLFSQYIKSHTDNHQQGSDCFGWALEEALEGRGHRLRSSGEKQCVHHHQLRYAFQKSSGDGSVTAATTTVEEARTPAGNNSDNTTTTTHRGPSQRWRWWPTRHELATHYIRDIGFLACLAQMIGATIFWIAGFTGLPPILDALSVPAANGIYWLPQVVGGTGFIVSGLLFMIEVQDKWWKPAPRMLGWHVGFWNLIGAIGFTLCGALGFGSERSESVEYASALSTFVGSWAFLVSHITTPTLRGCGYSSPFSPPGLHPRRPSSSPFTYVAYRALIYMRWLKEPLEGEKYMSLTWMLLTCWTQIGAVIQWYESLDKYPISIGKLPSGLASSSSAKGK